MAFPPKKIIKKSRPIKNVGKFNNWSDQENSIRWQLIRKKKLQKESSLCQKLNFLISF